MQQDHQICKVPETAKELRIAEPTVWSWIYGKKLPFIRLGRKIFIKRETIEKILSEGLDLPAPGLQDRTTGIHRFSFRDQRPAGGGGTRHKDRLSYYHPRR